MSRSARVAAAVSIATIALIYGVIEHGRTLRAERALRLLPQSARGVLHIDVAAIGRHAAGAALIEAFLPAGQLTEIEVECGLDPIVDLGDAIVWVGGSDREAVESVGLILTGRGIDAEALAACHRRLVEARGGSVFRVDAATGPMLASRDGRSAVALLDSRTIVTGSARTVTEAVAVHRGLAPALTERASIANIWSGLARDAAVAAAVDPPDHWRKGLERAASFGKESSALEGIDAIGLSIRPAEGPDWEIVLDAKSEALANQSAQRLRGLAATPPDTLEPPWDELLRSARVEIEARHVLVRLDPSPLARRR